MKTKALLLVAALVFGGIAVFAILSGATATPGGGYGGYGSKSPTPSRTRSSPPPSATTPAPSPSEELPQTGTRAGNDSAITGVSLTAGGMVLLAFWWVWHAQNHARQPRTGRHQLRPRHR